MKEIAKIAKIEDKLIHLVCGPSGCGSCAAKNMCSAKDKEYTALNKKDLELSTGDSVEVLIPEGKTIFASFLTLILPLILFILAFFLATKYLGITNEVFAALFGFLGLFVGFGISAIYARTNLDNKLPIVLKRVEKN